MSVCYKRVLLKISGEALAGEQGYGIDLQVLETVAVQVESVHHLGIQMAIVVGGGNIFRGLRGATQGMDRALADYMGMLATVMNSLALQDILERKGLQTRVLSAIEMPQLAELYIRRRAIRHLEKGRIVIFAAGTGNPFFTTDTAAALRAIEVNAEIMLKATKVDGIYTEDPLSHANAKRYEKLSYLQVLQKGIKVMDATAISLCMDNHLPILVFNLQKDGELLRAVRGEKVGTLVASESKKG